MLGRVVGERRKSCRIIAIRITVMAPDRSIVWVQGGRQWTLWSLNLCKLEVMGLVVGILIECLFHYGTYERLLWVEGGCGRET